MKAEAQRSVHESCRETSGHTYREDHPLEYAEFEGVIPEGQYGAGTVMVWDTGTYDPQNDIPPDKQLAQGKIDVVLHGAKLRGGFTLVRTARRSADSNDKERWLLIKHRDEYADPSWDIEDPRFDRSVLTGRSLKEIESGRPKKRFGIRATRLVLPLEVL